MTSKQEFLSQIDRAAATMPGLPVTTALLRRLAEDLRKEDPPWWRGTLKAWEKRSFVAWSEAWSLFLTSVHFEALSDAESPLAPYFPSCGGTDEADPSEAFAGFLSDLPRSFFEHLRTGQRRTYVEARSALWMPPAAVFFQGRGLPFYLVEANSGAGLNLAADLVAREKGLDSELIAARIGLDPLPLELEDIGHRRWLTAGIMPDQMPMIRALDRAIEALRERQSREAAFIQLVPCPPELAPRFIAKNIPAGDKDVGLLLFNMGTTVRMTDEEYEAFRDGIAQTLRPWEDRALWVEVENVRGEIYSTTYQLRAHRLLEGGLRTQVMASFDFGAQKTSFDSEETLKFLSPA